MQAHSYLFFFRGKLSIQGRRGSLPFTYLISLIPLGHSIRSVILSTRLRHWRYQQCMHDVCMHTCIHEENVGAPRMNENANDNVERVTE